MAGILDMKQRPAWIRFEIEDPPDPRRKTERWAVVPREATSNASAIGVVKWYGAWRKYAFFPFQQTLYEPTCLRDIADFIDHQMELRKATRRAASSKP